MTQRAKTGRKWKNQGSSPRAFQSNREEIIKKLYEDLSEWEKGLAQEKIAELVAAFLDKYHGNNPKLIAMQDPQATDVDAHGAWRERGRTNIGSGNGIKIICPSYTDVCKTCNEHSRHANHIGNHTAQAAQAANLPVGGKHVFDPVVTYYYDTTYDIRFTIPDTAEARKAWQDDHPADAEGKRYWDDADNYKDYEKYGV